MKIASNSSCVSPSNGSSGLDSSGLDSSGLDSSGLNSSGLDSSVYGVTPTIASLNGTRSLTGTSWATSSIKASRDGITDASNPLSVSNPALTLFI